MPLLFLFDEHLRGWPFRIIQRHNARGLNPLDVVSVGDDDSVPRLGSIDSELIAWAEVNRRIIVTRDGKTMPGHLKRHLSNGHHSPGIFILRNVFFGHIVEFLTLAAHASESSEWEDRAFFIP